MANTPDEGWSIGLTVSNKTNKHIAVGAAVNIFDNADFREADLRFLRGIISRLRSEQSVEFRPLHRPQPLKESTATNTVRNCSCGRFVQASLLKPRSSHEKTGTQGLFYRSRREVSTTRNDNNSLHASDESRNQLLYLLKCANNSWLLFSTTHNLPR